MTLLAKNLAVLKARFPGLVANLEADVARLPRLDDPPEFFDARSGARTARWRGLALASAFDPAAEGRKSVPSVPPGADFALVGGLGMGYHAEALLAAFPDLPLLVAEADPRWFHALLAERDLTGLLGNPMVSLMVGGQPSQVGAYLGRFVCRHVLWVPHRTSFSLQPAWLGEMEKALADFQVLARVNHATLERFAPLWLRNLAHNEAALADGLVAFPVEALHNAAPGCRVVIAAAGPSLEGQLDWLRRSRDRFVLIAVDTCCNTLRSAGVTPDFLVIMDGQYWNSRHVDPPVKAPTRVVAELVSHPSTLRLAPGRLFLAATSVPLLRETEVTRWGDLGVLKSGGSVSTTAWSLALHLGASEVAFCGLDLGYAQGGGHVRGSQFEERKHRRSSRLVPAETWGLGWLGESNLSSRPTVGGGSLKSDPRMDLYRQWLSLSVAEHPEVTAWNLSPVGSLIPGLKSPGVNFAADWPVQLPLARSLSAPLKAGPGVATRVTSPEGEMGFPPRLSADWIGRWETQGLSLWGATAWAILGSQAVQTWRQFPTPRSEHAVRAAWSFERSLKSQIFHSRKPGLVRS